MGLISLGIGLAYRGVKGAYDSQQEDAQHRQAAEFVQRHGWGCIASYSSHYRADPRAEREFLPLPANADMIHRSVHTVYSARVCRARGDDQTAVLLYSQFLSAWFNNLSSVPQYQQQIAYDMQHGSRLMPPNELALRLQKWSDFILDIVYPGQSQYWVPQFQQQAQPVQVPAQGPMNAEAANAPGNGTEWQKYADGLMPPSNVSTPGNGGTAKTDVPPGYEDAKSLSV